MTATPSTHPFVLDHEAELTRLRTRYERGYRLHPELQNALMQLADDRLTISYFGDRLERASSGELDYLNRSLAAMLKLVETEQVDRKGRKI